MNRYRMYLIMGSLELPLQVLPEKLAVRAAGPERDGGGAGAG